MSTLLVLCGPTATGKTALALSLAKQFNGEIINADSRQVYRGMDIGTGKDIPVSSRAKRGDPVGISVSDGTASPDIHRGRNDVFVGYRQKDGIPIWLVDIVDPDYSFNVSQYVRLAEQVIADIRSRGKLPIVVGGTGFYIKALINPPATLHIPTNEAVRKRLDEMSVEQLQEELARLDTARIDQMNESDRNNPRRLVRAIEVALQKGLTFFGKGQTLPVHRDTMLTISLHVPLAQLYERIDARVEERYQEGVVDEIHDLLEKGYSWHLPSFSGCGYRVWKPFFEGNVTKEEILQRWKYQEHAYARRQLTWFRKQTDIRWFDITETDCKKRIMETVKAWYTKS